MHCWNTKRCMNPCWLSTWWATVWNALPAYPYKLALDLLHRPHLEFSGVIVFEVPSRDASLEKQVKLFVGLPISLRKAEVSPDDK